MLAGGQSSRMGRDKAWLELAGKPLVQHAVTKLQRVCRDVAVLGSDEGLRAYAPVVEDLHPGCGPMSGMEAALVHSGHDWNLILPVDVPFLPTALLRYWAGATISHGRRDGTRVAMFVVEGIPQPALLMIHREVAPYLTNSIFHGEYKLGPTLYGAAGDLAEKLGVPAQQLLRRWAWGAESKLTVGESFPVGPTWATPTEAQEAAKHLWFANLNTPEDFAEAERNLGALDT